jgi:serine/threonine protein kinase
MKKIDLNSKLKENSQRDPNEKIAAKAKDIENRTKLVDNIMNELFILDLLRSECGEYIMCYERTFIQDNNFYIVCEYLDGYITLDNKTIDINNNMLEVVIPNLITGLNKLHSLHIYHRDIKPGNIMYHPHTYKIKYIDFGLSTIYIGGITKSRVPLVCMPYQKSLIVLLNHTLLHQNIFWI